jgi:hypothetical protein
MHQNVNRDHARDANTDMQEAYRSLADVESRMEEKMRAELKAGSDRMDSIEAKLDANCRDTAEVLEILRLGKSFFKMIGHIGAFMKWAAAIAAPVVAVYFAWKTGANDGRS